MDSAIIYGKKTIGFPTTMADVPHLAKLLREDTQGSMGKYCLKTADQESAEMAIVNQFQVNKMMAWTFHTKEGKRSRIACFVLLEDLTEFSCSIMVFMDMQFAKGLTSQMRKDKYTFSEDALRGTLDFCFNKVGLERVEAEVLDFNKRSMALVQKAGFKREGIKRKAFNNDGKLINTHIFAILKGESNG